MNWESIYLTCFITGLLLTAASFIFGAHFHIHLPVHLHLPTGVHLPAASGEPDRGASRGVPGQRAPTARDAGRGCGRRSRRLQPAGVTHVEPSFSRRCHARDRHTSARESVAPAPPPYRVLALLFGAELPQKSRKAQTILKLDRIARHATSPA